MQRIPEPELMDDGAQARAYADADFGEAHQHFIELFRDRFPQLELAGEVLDLGCGPCDITRRFAKAFPQTSLHAVDGAMAMLELAQAINRREGLADRIELVHATLPGLELPQRHYHTIISNSLLHHLHDPHALWDTLQQAAKPFANVFVMDLMRPESEQQVRAIVEQYAANETDILRHDFYHSLCAAFTPDEVKQQLQEHSLSQLHLEAVSDRHMIIFGTL